jgi:hypothetical protein
VLQQTINTMAGHFTNADLQIIAEHLDRGKKSNALKAIALETGGYYIDTSDFINYCKDEGTMPKHQYLRVGPKLHSYVPPAAPDPLTYTSEDGRISVSVGKIPGPTSLGKIPTAGGKKSGGGGAGGFILSYKL